jgi:Rieske 2Fe-2S family protein
VEAPGQAWLDAFLRELRGDFPHASPLPRRFFSDPAVFALDESLFRGSWLPVAHAGELAQPGAFAISEIGRERVVVTRGPDLELAAFLDGCLHRGTPLFDKTSGRLADLQIVCPYHGLRYDLRGRADASRCPSIRLGERRALTAVRVEERFGFVFVCMSESTEGIDAWLGEVPPWLDAAALFALQLGQRWQHLVACNWKLLVQNFQESHHFERVHPGLAAVTPARESTSRTFDGRFLGGTMKIGVGSETVSETGSRNGRPFVAAADDRQDVYDALLMPAWLTSLQPDYFLSYRLLPRSATETLVTADIYFHASAFAGGFDPSDVVDFWAKTNAEDRAICERQQRGMAAPSFEPGPYASVEDGLFAFDEKLIEAYRRLLWQAAAP